MRWAWSEKNLATWFREFKLRWLIGVVRKAIDYDFILKHTLGHGQLIPRMADDRCTQKSSGRKKIGKNLAGSYFCIYKV